MALPPVPLEEVLPEATAVVEATVIEIVETGSPVAGQPKLRHQHVGGNILDPSQTLRLRVTRVLRGQLDGELTAIKPEAPYLLRAEVSGPFLLREEDGDIIILGRYGPDSYSLAAIERALAG